VITSTHPLRALGDVLTLDLDKVTVKPAETYPIAGMYSFGRGLLTRPAITGADTSYQSLFRLHGGSIIMSRLNGWEGAIALVGNEHDGAFVSSEYPTFSIDNGKADSAYLGYLCQWPEFWAALRDVARGMGSDVGARRLRVHPDNLLRVEVPLPELPEQRRIAGHIENVYRRLDEIETLSARSAKLVRGLAPSVLNTSWKRRPLGELVRQVRREEAVDPSRGYRLLGVRWYGGGLFVREEKQGSEVGASKLYRIEAGDFVYNRLFAWKGSFAVAGKDVAGAYVSGEFPTFEVDTNSLDVRYLLGLFSDPRVWVIVEDKSVGGTPTSRNRLKEAAFLRLEVPVPPVREQMRLANLIDQLQSADQARVRRVRYAVALRKSVLNTAFARPLIR
jgi:type I restriction enzyme, S subunit